MSTPRTSPTPRRWPRRLLLGLLGVIALLALGVAWLLGTGGGRDATLAWLQSRLGDEALTFSSAEGTVGGTLELRNVRWRGDGVEVGADRLLLTPRKRDLFSGDLAFSALEADNLEVWLAPSPAEPPEPWTPWPELLPRIPLGFELSAERLAVEGLRVVRGDEPLFEAQTVTASQLALRRDGLEAGELLASGEWGEARLAGHYRPADDFATDLQGRLRLAAPDDQSEDATLQLAVDGDVRAMRAEASGRAGGPFSLQATLEDGLGEARWQLEATADALAPQWFGAAPGSQPLDLSASLEGRGGGGAGRLELTQGETTLALEDLEASFAGAGIALDAGRLLTPYGELQVEGLWDPLAEETLALQARSEALRWTPAEGGATVTAAGTVSLTGLPENWQATLEATLERAGETATLRASGRGDTEAATLETLALRTPGGALQGSGRVAWTPALAIEGQAQLDRVDPGYLLPDYPGALSGQLAVDLVQADAGWRGTLQLSDLAGTLRGRPVSGRASVDWQGETGQLDAALALGESRLQAAGRIGNRLDLRVQAQPLRLADLAEGAGGTIEGELQVRGPRAAPGLVADLNARDLRWADVQLDAASLRGDLPANAGSGSLVLDGTGLAFAGRRADGFTLRADGHARDLALRAEARREALRIALVGTAIAEGNIRRGVLRELQLEAPRAPTLTLREPADWTWGPRGFEISPACVVADGEGFLCLQASPGELQVDGDRIALALAQPWLPDVGMPVSLEGRVSLQAELRRGNSGWAGEAQLLSAEGGVLGAAGETLRPLLRYRDLEVNATLAPDGLQARAGAQLNQEGLLMAELHTGTTDDAPLEGQLVLRMRDLTWLELLSPDIVRPTGLLDGEMRLSGTRGAPRVEGQVQLRELATEVPALGLALQGGELELQAGADGRTVLSGQVRSGDGVLRANGSLDLASEQPLSLALTGENVTFADTPDLRLTASPALVFGMGDNRLRVTGRVDVPSARVNLEALDNGAVQPSPDVVLVDAEVPRDDGPVLDLAVHVSLGEDVQLRGFGLDGKLAGALDIRQAPGRTALATGTLRASGEYSAYGQELQIVRARLAYAGAPVDNPTLDILAERDRGDVTVGVQVRGSARRPETRVVSTPAMDTSEALSWLVFGRPLQSTTANQSSQLEASALALGVGGNLVAQRLGEGLGLDSAGVEESRALGGATFTVGKYLSPRLFLGYGISLVGRGQVVTLKYLLSRGFDITIESGTESAASLNWRTER